MRVRVRMETFESRLVLIIFTITGVVRCITALSSTKTGTISGQQPCQLKQSKATFQSSQTDTDIDMENWYKSQGIFGTSRISLCTSSKSVGGRGLFWVDDNSAEQGDIVAFIPSKCVIASSNLKNVYPTLAPMEDSEASWQSKLTAYACSCLTDPKPMQPSWGHWIESWPGGGPAAPRPSSEYSLDELKELANFAEASTQDAKEAIDARYDCMKRDWEAVKTFYAEDEDHFANLYSIVVSRTARLGAEWQNKGGIIPLHDMCNHPPFDRESNVELFCVGDIIRMIGNDNFTLLMDDFISGGNLKYQDQDILLVASRDIQPGNELWLKYKSRSKMETKEKLWLMLQYGFPFHV